LGECDETVTDAAPTPVGTQVQLGELVVVEHHHADDAAHGSGVRHPGLAQGYDDVPEVGAYVVGGAWADDRGQGGGEGGQPDVGRGGGIGVRGGSAERYGEGCGRQVRIPSVVEGEVVVMGAVVVDL